MIKLIQGDCLEVMAASCSIRSQVRVALVWLVSMRVAHLLELSLSQSIWRLLLHESTTPLLNPTNRTKRSFHYDK